MDAEYKSRSHLEVVDDVGRSLRRLLQDPLLTDLRPDVTPDEISMQLALLQGRALKLRLRFYHDQSIPLVVLQGSTVRGVMQAVERAVKSWMTSSEVISWSYVWRTYWLACGQVRLEDEAARLDHYGIGSHAELRFVRKQRRTSRKY